ncbi:acyl-CoA carboxylase epsilon subunit, partial [Actinomadura sp. NPDC049753]|uniref:acyl-CoA carboxylase epsilon subunit n=1 Tax=Actinomadura sp. NPDC049753 TaxID=3154739 RepID=UPI0034304A93
MGEGAAVSADFEIVKGRLDERELAALVAVLVERAAAEEAGGEGAAGPRAGAGGRAAAG